ncbi:uncharacterized protein [Chironomus tepperi]|uniref:uncharacterized protein n=1 Tax=Chironomus tepperi TaxID=113505 RepID=UPI00391EED1A
MTDSNFQVRQQMIENVKQHATKAPRRFNIFALESFSDFKKLHEKLNSDDFNFQGHYILTLINGKIDEIQEIFDDLWKLQIHNVIVIYENIKGNGHLSVLTFFPFRSSTDCSNTTPVLINEFINGTFIRGFSNIFPNKMKNLHQCEIIVGSSNNVGPFIYTKAVINGKRQLAGLDYEVLNTLSQSLNFKANVKIESDYGCIFGYNGIVGLLTNLQNNELDLVIVDCWLRLSRLKLFDASSTYFFGKVVMAFPMKADLSSFEKLFYSLSNYTWMLLIIYLTIGVTSIFIIRLLSKTIQNFIIGEEVRHPYFNMFIGIIGQSHSKIPGTNFARFLLMNFLLFTLVIRTAYQGKLFEIMQLDIKYSEPKTILEMIERGYKLYVPDFLLDHVPDPSKFEVV